MAKSIRQTATAIVSTINALGHIRTAADTAEADVKANPRHAREQLLLSLEAVRRELAGGEEVLAIDGLKARYRRVVDELARRFKPELAAAARKPEGEQVAVANRLAAACQAALCRTTEQARIAGALAPRWARDNDNIEEWPDVRRGAAEVVAYDVAARSGIAWCREFYGLEARP